MCPMAGDSTAGCQKRLWHLLVVVHACVAASDLRLRTVQVNVVYRHGDRSALVSFPKDIHKESTWPQGYGQLSRFGMQQHYELGRYFKRRYKDLLSSDYVNSEIRVRSTDFDRTLMSAYSNLAGLFPPIESQAWNPAVQWQPVPVHTVPVDSDILLGQASCERYASLMEESKSSPAVINITTRYAAFFNALSTLSGADISDLFAVRSLYDTIYCEQQHNLTLPEWCRWSNITGDKTKACDTIRAITAFTFWLQVDSREKQRLIAGTLIEQIRQNMDAMAANKTGTAKMYMYSAHDTTVVSLLSALEVYDGKLTEYTATVMVELLRDYHSGEHFVSIYYKNGISVIDPESLTIPGCDNPCPLSNFKTLTDSVVPADWNYECRNTLPYHTQSEIVIVTVCCCILFYIVMTFVIPYLRRKMVISGCEAPPHSEQNGHHRAVRLIYVTLKCCIRQLCYCKNVLYRKKLGE